MTDVSVPADHILITQFDQTMIIATEYVVAVLSFPSNV